MALVLGAAVIVVAARPSRSRPSFVATGQPVQIPADRLAPVSAAEFEGMLVGLRGRPVVVNVWASWCPPCRAEMPLLQRASRSYAGRATFLGVASKDSPDAAAAFLDRVGVSYPNVLDDRSEVSRLLKLRGFPTTYMFDADGRLVHSVIGGITEQRLAAQLDDLLR